MKKLSIIQRNKNSGSKIWYLRIFNTETHRINYKSTNTTVKYKAEQILEKQKQKIYLNPDEEKIESLPPLNELSIKYLDYVSTNFTAGTLRIYKARINEFLAFCKTHELTRFSEIKPIHANDIINPQTVKGITKRNKKMTFQAFFNWILSTYDIDKKNVFAKVKSPKVQKPIREFWTPEQIKIILRNCTNKQIRLSFALMAFCGLRIAETKKLRWCNLTEKTIEIINGKGGKNSVLPLSDNAKDEIKLYLNYKPIPSNDDKIFSVSIKAIDTELKRICKASGINGHNHPHKFRHSFASNLLRNGGNIIAVSKLMRHATPSITLNIYAHILPNDLEQTLKLLDGAKTETKEQGGDQ